MYEVQLITIVRDVQPTRPQRHDTGGGGERRGEKDQPTSRPKRIEWKKRAVGSNAALLIVSPRVCAACCVVVFRVVRVGSTPLGLAHSALCWVHPDWYWGRFISSDETRKARNDNKEKGEKRGQNNKQTERKRRKRRHFVVVARLIKVRPDKGPKERDEHSQQFHSSGFTRAGLTNKYQERSHRKCSLTWYASYLSG